MATEERQSKQISVSVPIPFVEVLQAIAESTGKSVSGLCAAFIEDGMYSEIEKQNKLNVFLRMREKKGLGKPE